MSCLYLDTETYHETLDLKKVGAYRYIEGCELMLLSYALDSEAPQIWDRTQQPRMPGDLREYLQDPAVTIKAHFAMFDRNVVNRTLDLSIPRSRWYCTMTKAYSMGMPGALADLGRALGIPEDDGKLADGKRLIQLFCKPVKLKGKKVRLTWKDRPEDWENFKAYALQDIVAMRICDHRLPDINYTGSELDLYHLDQKINDHGLPMDIEGAKAAIDLVQRATEKLNHELAQITGGRVTAFTQVQQIEEFIASEGVELHDLTKGYVAQLLAGDLPRRSRRVLEIRQSGARISTAKYSKVIECVCEDGRLHGTIQMNGAPRTGRFAGRLFQPHNLPRPAKSIGDIELGMETIVKGSAEALYDDIMELASSCVRATIKAPDGYQLATSDLSNIEGRQLAWLAGEAWKVDAFRDYDTIVGHAENGKPIRKGDDLYKLAYSRSFHISPDKVGDDQRQIGKVQELALGYQGAVGAFNSMAANYGVNLPEDFVVELVQAWRDAHPNIVRFWYSMEAAAIKAAQNPGRTFKVRRILLHSNSRWLFIKLPSGRCLCYFRPEVRRVKTPWGEKDQLTYWGSNQYVRWGRISTYGGKLVENITQAAARDVLKAGMLAADAAGYEVIGTVHDELITLVPEGGDLTHQRLEQLMAIVPDWAPGLPLAAEGKTTKRYTK